MSADPFELTDLEKTFREIFYKHVAAIPSDLGRVEEISGPDTPGYAEAGINLSLDLFPLRPDFCRLGIDSDGEDFYVLIGKGQCDYLSYIGDPKSIASWPEWIERDITNVIHGRVKEVERFFGKTIVDSVTYVLSDSEEWRTIPTWHLTSSHALVCLLSAFMMTRKREKRYRSYLGDDGP